MSATGVSVSRVPHRPRAVRPYRQRRAGVSGGLAAVGLGVLLVFEGVGVAINPLLGLPAVALMVIGLAAALPLPIAGLVGAALAVRVLDDHAASVTTSPTARLSVAVALFLILLGIGTMARHRRALGPIAAAALWVGVWTLLAAASAGASATTFGEGIREMSVVAVVAVAANLDRRWETGSAIRIAQLIGLVPALLTLFQVAAHRGMDISGQIRPNGTFSHPNSAALFFAVLGAASLSRFIVGWRFADALACGLFVVATFATYSIDGAATMVVMLLVVTMSRYSRAGFRVAAWTAVCATAVLFAVSPGGAARLSSESSSVQASGSSARPSSLEWRFMKWNELLASSKGRRLWGEGLGTTTLGLGDSELAASLPHNEYIRYFVETGAIGCLLLLYGLGRLWRRVQAVAQSDSAEYAPLAKAIVIGFLVNALAANTLLYSPATYVAVLLLALIVLPDAGRTPDPAVLAR